MLKEVTKIKAYDFPFNSKMIAHLSLGEKNNDSLWVVESCQSQTSRGSPAVLVKEPKKPPGLRKLAISVNIYNTLDSASQSLGPEPEKLVTNSNVRSHPGVLNPTLGGASLSSLCSNKHMGWFWLKHGKHTDPTQSHSGQALGPCPTSLISSLGTLWLCEVVFTLPAANLIIFALPSEMFSWWSQGNQKPTQWMDRWNQPVGTTQE